MARRTLAAAISLACLAVTMLPPDALAAGVASFPDPGFDRTIQGDAAQSLHVRVCNVAGGDTTDIDRVRFLFAGANDQYDFSPTQPTVAPSGWTAEFRSNNEIRFLANAAADRITLGSCRTFDVRLEPNGANASDTFARDAAGDVTDRFSDVRVRHQPSGTEAASLAATIPWKRHGLALTLSASPASVAAGATVGLQYLVENRTLAAQTVSSLPAAPTAAQGSFSGPAATTPASSVIAAGNGATLSYAATNASGPTLQFRAATSSGAATSPSTLSNVVLVGAMTASLEVVPASIISGERFDVVMRVRNNGTTSLGGVQPTRDPTVRSTNPDPLSIGTAAIAKVSGPTPSLVPSLAPGTTAIFRWTYTASGSVGQTFQVSGGALANGVPNPPFPGNQTALSTSNAGTLASLGVRVTPPVIARGDTSPVTFSLSNGTAFSDNNHVRLDFPAGFAVASSTSPSGYSCVVNGAQDSVTCNPIGANQWDVNEVLDIAVTFTPTGVPIPTGDADQPHQIFIHHHLIGPGTDTSGTLLVSAYLLDLVAAPASAPADGLSVVDLTATLTRVSTGLPKAGETIAFESSAGRLASSSGVTGADGKVVVRLIAPASSTTVLASVSATQFNRKDLETVTFTGFNGPLLLYVGGSLYQRQVAPGTGVAFQIDVSNLGSSAVNVTAGTFSFTSPGTGCTFTAPLPPTTVAAGASATLSFSSATIPAGCLAGNQTFPVFSYNPTQSIDDPLTISATPTFASIVDLDAEPFGAGVRLRWATDLELDNAGFRILHAAGSGEPEVAGWVDASGESFSSYQWIDDRALSAGLHSWWIEDLSLDGIATLHGPVFLSTSEDADADADADAAGAGGAPSVGAAADGSIWDDPDDLGDVRVLARDESGITYEITPPPYTVDRVPWPVALRDRIRIEGYGSTEDPGLPMLPVRAFRVPLPAWTEGTLTVQREETELVTGLDPAVFLGEAGNVALAGLDVPSTGVFPARVRAAARTYPAASASLIDGGKIGDTSIASLALVPLRWDAATSTLHRTVRLVVRVAFRPAAPAAHLPPSAADALHQRLLAAPSLKVEVTGSGLVRVPRAAVAAAGVDPDACAVFRRGAPVPSRMAGDEVVFPAPLEGDSWLDRRAFWISSSEPGRVLPLEGAPVPATALTGVLRTERFEQNRIHGLLSAQGNGPDRWYWAEIFSSTPADVNFTLPAAAPAGALLTLTLQGMYDAPESEAEHAVRVRLGGVDLGTVSLAAFQRRSFDLPVPAGVLVAGPNALRLESVSPVVSRVALDAVALSWTGPADASGGVELALTALGAGPLTAGGFAEDVAYAIDETDPASPRLLAVSSEPDGSGGYRAAVDAGAGARIRFISGTAGPSAAWTARPGRTLSVADAEYVVIAADGLGDAARGFVDWRRTTEGGALRGAVFEANDIYDDASFGDIDPLAVRQFLQRARAEAPTWAPRYLLLVGDSTFDPANRLGAGVPQGLLLSGKVSTEVLWASSDATLATLDGDGLPDLAVGRVPARTAAEVAAALARVRAYEAASRDGWDARALFVSDDDLPEFDRSSLDALAYRPAGTDVRQFSASVLGDAAAREGLLGSFSEGIALATFVGHGGVQTWGGEPFLGLPDIAGLAPPARPPVVLAVNCLNGFFDHPLAEGLSESLVRGEAGAVAVYSSSAITRNEGHREMAAAFHRAFWREPSARRLGDVVLQAMAATSWRDDAAELAATFVLMGDPALRLNVNSPPTAVVRLEAIEADRARLSGHASFDPDGDALDWRWELIAEPDGAGARLESVGPDASLVTSMPGTYRVRLRVADGRVTSPADEQAVEIRAADGTAARGCAVAAQGAAAGRASVPLFALLIAVWVVVRRR